MELQPTEGVTYVISPTAMMKSQTFVSIVSIDKMHSGQINIPSIILIIIEYTAILMWYIMLTLHVVVAVQEDGVFPREDVS